MPLYEYSCPSCAREFEKIKAVENRHHELCPWCLWPRANLKMSVPILATFPIKGVRLNGQEVV